MSVVIFGILLTLGLAVESAIDDATQSKHVMLHHAFLEGTLCHFICVHQFVLFDQFDCLQGIGGCVLLPKL